MSTEVVWAEDGDKKFLWEASVGEYLHGKCFVLALLFCEVFEDDVFFLYDSFGSFRHAFCKTKEGLYRDARGFVGEKELGEPFGVDYPYSIRQVDVEEIRKFLVNYGELFPGGKEMFLARVHAERVWPTWPWPNSFFERVRAFTEELEEISRKYGVWVRSQLPTQLPVLSLGDDEEKGYTLTQTSLGNSFLIDRRF